MAFTPDEIASHADLIERLFWSKRRPALHVRDRMREGQRIAGQEIELFFVRPRFDDPTQHLEEPLAKARYVRSRQVWQIFWQRADLKWHRYQPHPEVAALADFLRIVDADEHGCFFG